MRKRCCTMVLMLLAIAVSFPPASARPNPAASSAPVLGAGWVGETVDESGYVVGWSNSIEIDATGRVCLGYSWTRQAQEELRYACRSETTGWVTETVTAASVADVSLASNGGQTGIGYLYWDGAAYDMGYAYLGPTDWVTETVDAGLGDAAWTSSLAISAAGEAHIGYGVVGLGTSLRHAYQSGPSWITETVVTFAQTGESFLALDSVGRPHIAYFRDNTVRHTYYSSTAWISETVALIGGSEGNPSLVLDALDRPRVAYFNLSGSPTLEYAYRNGSWYTETVVLVGESNWAGWGVSLALDGDDYPHIAYTFAQAGDDCLYLAYAYDNGTGWVTETVDLTCQTWYPSLVVDAHGRPHISYFSYWPGTLQYARRPYQCFLPLVVR